MTRDPQISAERYIYGYSTRLRTSRLVGRTLFILRAADFDPPWLGPYAKEREVFGSPIGKNQGVQFPLARAFAHMVAAEAIVYRAASHYDAGQDPGVEANTAKMLAADASWEAAEACLQTHGGFGFAEEYNDNGNSASNLHIAFEPN